MNSALRLDAIQVEPRPRWFVQVNGIPRWESSFASKRAANDWISSHGDALDWRVGFLFRLRGEPVDVEIVDKGRRRASA